MGGFDRLSVRMLRDKMSLFCTERRLLRDDVAEEQWASYGGTVRQK